MGWKISTYIPENTVMVSISFVHIKKSSLKQANQFVARNSVFSFCTTNRTLLFQKVALTIFCCAKAEELNEIITIGILPGQPDQKHWR